MNDAKALRVSSARITKKLLNEYVAMVEGKVNAYWERRGFQKNLGDPNTIILESSTHIHMGKKYARIVSVAPDNWCYRSINLNAKTMIGRYPGKSVHTFINMQTGDILKAGSWKAPHFNGVLGNILADDRGASVVNEHGANYRY